MRLYQLIPVHYMILGVQDLVLIIAAWKQHLIHIKFLVLLLCITILFWFNSKMSIQRSCSLTDSLNPQVYLRTCIFTSNRGKEPNVLQIYEVILYQVKNKAAGMCRDVEAVAASWLHFIIYHCLIFASHCSNPQDTHPCLYTSSKC